jgi:hypothetical protein
MSDDLGIEGLSELLVPQQQAAREQITDAFEYNVGFNFAFAGVGQCGGRIAQTFHQLGYRRVCALNTTIADMRSLRLEDAQKLDLGSAQGAGKDPEIAKALFDDRDEDIFDLFVRNWGDDVDYGFVCLGQKFAKNCLHTMRQLVELDISPVIFIDNQKIRELYHPGAGEEHRKENGTTAANLHMFNRLAGTDSEHTTFDRQDLAKLLDAGVITFAAASITGWSSAADISTPIREQLRGNVLATLDVSEANMAGLVYVLNGTAYDEVKSADLDHGTAMFTRMLADDSTVFPGVYRGTTPSASILVLAMIGALPWPQERLNQLASEAGVDKDIVSNILGI